MIENFGYKFFSLLCITFKNIITLIFIVILLFFLNKFLLNDKIFQNYNLFNILFCIYIFILKINELK